MAKKTDKNPSELDQELAQAAGLDDDAPEEVMAVPQPPEGRAEAQPASRGSKSNMGLLATLLVMTVGIVCLFMFGFEDAAVYSMPVDQFLAQKDKHVDRRVRLEGELVPGTYLKVDKPCKHNFRIKAGDRELEINYAQCVVPDTFRDVPEGGVEVTVEGILRGEVFEADLIMAKCSSKYDAETHTMDGKSAAKAPSSATSP